MRIKSALLSQANKDTSYRLIVHDCLLTRQMDCVFFSYLELGDGVHGVELVASSLLLGLRLRSRMMMMVQLVEGSCCSTNVKHQRWQQQSKQKRTRNSKI